MLHNVFTVLDTKVGAYMTPFFSRSRGEAIRSFQDACSQPDSAFSKHPEDFVMFHLGEYDDNTAEFKLIAPESLAKAIDFVK